MGGSVLNSPAPAAIVAAPAGGTLTVARPQTSLEGALSEQTFEFRSLQELIDLCVANEGGGAFLRVHIRGHSGRGSYRLALDFGHFGLIQD